MADAQLNGTTGLSVSTIADGRRLRARQQNYLRTNTHTHADTDTYVYCRWPLNGTSSLAFRLAMSSRAGGCLVKHSVSPLRSPLCQLISHVNKAEKIFSSAH